MSLKSWAIRKWADKNLIEMNRQLSKQLDEQSQLIRAAAERWYPKQREWKEETTRLKEQAKELKKEVAKYRLRCVLQRSEANMEPLTMNQIMDMDGSFVWVDAPNQSDWALARAHKDKDDVILWNVDGGCWSFKAAGDSIKVYERKVQHIDRSAWEPCDYCENTLQNRKVYKTEKYSGLCDFEVFLDNGQEITVNAHNHQTPYTEEICFSFPVSYCPKCGRPLTPEAWDELGKRMGVMA